LQLQLSIAGHVLPYFPARIATNQKVTGRQHTDKVRPWKPWTDDKWQPHGMDHGPGPEAPNCHTPPVGL